MNRLTPNIVYGYVRVVHDKYRGYGIAKNLTRNFYTDQHFGSASSMAIAHHGLHGPHWLEKRLDVHGFVQKAQIDQLKIPKNNIRIEIVTHDNTNAMLEYDRTIHSITNRDKFVCQWSAPPAIGEPQYGRSVLALDQMGKCIGYGTLRLFSDFYSIQPLYADNDEIAWALLVALVKRYWQDDAYLHMAFMANKKPAVEFYHTLGLSVTFTGITTCSTALLEFAKSLPTSKVYAVHEFYPL